MIRLLTGDVRDVLAMLPANSVQCVVTSPPYYGLRDYGTAQWEGGAAGCDHIAGSNYGTKSDTNAGAIRGGPYRDTCGKCGARRIDRQIGLEATPDEYIATMVAVFREVKRVLRDDGTCFVNLGDSYASGGMRPNQSRQPSHALACDNGDTAPEGSPALGYACSDLCDGCRDFLLSRKADSNAPLEAALHRENEGGHQLSVVLLDALASTMPQSSPPPPDVCSHCSNCGACLSVLRSSSRDARECVRSSWLNIPKFNHKPKDLMMMPARLALSLQADGWWLRSDIIWAKPNPMPESVTDRPTSAHEHVFLLTKRSRYFYDAEAVREEAEGEATGSMHHHSLPGTKDYYGNRVANFQRYRPSSRNLRNVWTIATAPFPAAHFATFPPELAERCIRAGSRPGDTILDPFSGAGTALLVADRLGRDAIGIDLSHAYVEMPRERLQADCPLFADINAAPVPEPPEDERIADLFQWAAN